MIKRFCDACGKELLGSDGRMGIAIPVHHLQPGCDGYVDNNLNAISGRDITLELCNGCSNRIYSKAVEELKRLQGVK